MRFQLAYTDDKGDERRPRLRDSNQPRWLTLAHIGSPRHHSCKTKHDGGEQTLSPHVRWRSSTCRPPRISTKPLLIPHKTPEGIDTVLASFRSVQYVCSSHRTNWTGKEFPAYLPASNKSFFRMDEGAVRGRRASKLPGATGEVDDWKLRAAGPENSETKGENWTQTPPSQPCIASETDTVHSQPIHKSPPYE